MYWNETNNLNTALAAGIYKYLDLNHSIRYVKYF